MVLVKAAAEFAGSKAADPTIKTKLNELNGRYIPVVQSIIVEGTQNKEFKYINIEDLTIITYDF